ncbi:MAG: hypothetical protein ABIQ44_10545, partial [Chloroflexia bacterium]
MYTSMPNTSGQTRIASLMAGFAGLIALVFLISGGKPAQAQSKEALPDGSANSCGFSWEHTGADIFSSFALHSIDAVSASDVWAVGEEMLTSTTRPIIEHWDGATWTITPQNEIPGGVQGLTVVSAVAANNVWAFGPSADSPSAVLHWDGSAWNTAFGPDVPITLSDGTAIASDDIWLVGSRTISAHRQSYATHWDGTAWTTMPVPGGVYSDTYAQAISVVAPDDIWVVGNSFAGSAHEAFTAHWDGTAWANVPLPTLGTDSTLYDIVATDADNAWAVGTYFDGGELTVILHWNGTEWATEDALGNDPRTAVDRGAGEIWVMGTGPFVQIQYLDPYFGWSATGGADIFPVSGATNTMASTSV